MRVRRGNEEDYWSPAGKRPARSRDLPRSTDRFPRTPAPSPRRRRRVPKRQRGRTRPSRAPAAWLGYGLALLFFSPVLPPPSSSVPPPANNLQRSTWKGLKPRRFLVKNPSRLRSPATAALPLPVSSPAPPAQGKGNFLCHREPESETRNKAWLFFPLFLRGEGGGRQPWGPGAADRRSLL